MRLHGSKGWTLLEMILATTLSLLVFAAVASFEFAWHRYFFKARDQVRATLDVTLVTHHFTSYMMRATSVNIGPGGVTFLSGTIDTQAAPTVDDLSDDQWFAYEYRAGSGEFWFRPPANNVPGPGFANGQRLSDALVATTVMYRGSQSGAVGSRRLINIRATAQRGDQMMTAETAVNLRSLYSGGAT
ncbi:MAG: hypothetical protein JW937_10580 [Candidatus Omnitrophica bacterium]|nr:hypothetical protein [Candidatus Omnitrophota bacterium]